MQKKRMTIIEACRDPDLFAKAFKNLTTWGRWLVFLRVMFGLNLNDEQMKVYRKCTGRKEPPSGAFRTAYLIVGRRAGKSFILSIIAIYMAVLRNWERFLSPGEVGTVMIIASDKKQARTIFRYCKGLLRLTRFMAKEIEGETTWSLELTHRIVIEIHAGSFRAVRSYTIVCALVDEAAFFRTGESANPDYEIVKALRPGLMTVPESVMLISSSPFAEQGIVWDAYKKHWGKDTRVLVWHASSLMMNPTINEAQLEEDYEEDPEAAETEWEAKFRSRSEKPFRMDVLENLIIRGRVFIPPMAHTVYAAFCDPAGGSGEDSMTLAIAHADHDNNMPILDFVDIVKPPFRPTTAVRRFADVMKSYGVYNVRGDKYAGDWPTDYFNKCGIAYDSAGMTKAEIYNKFLALVNSYRCELLDNNLLSSQICSLERRPQRTGAVVFDHPIGGHDDLANAAAGALVDVGEGLGIWDPSDAILGTQLTAASEAIAFDTGALDFQSLGEL